MIGRREHAQAMWESGEYTMRDIAAACGVEMSVVREWKRVDGWRTDFEPAELAPDVRERALELFDEDRTVSEIARELGVGRTTIYRWLDSRTAFAWRCGCTEYGGRLTTEHCPTCRRRAPFL